MTGLPAARELQVNSKGRTWVRPTACGFPQGCKQQLPERDGIRNSVTGKETGPLVYKDVFSADVEKHALYARLDCKAPIFSEIHVLETSVIVLGRWIA